MRRILLSLLLPILSILAVATAQDSGFVEPAGPTYETDEGTVPLSWARDEFAEGAYLYEVRRSTSPEFEDTVIVYSGADTAAYISGLPEGEFYFQVRQKQRDGTFGDWPEGYLQVNVKYIDRGLVTLLMSTGFVTFLAIVAAIVVGHNKTKTSAA